MLDPVKYLTAASWLEGYAKGIQDRKAHEILINRLNNAAELLKAVWVDFEKKSKGDQT